MKYKLILILMLCQSSFAANYYVKNTGSDDANGLDDAHAWATISKVNGESFSAGDTIYFNKGDTWREQLTVPSSGSEGSPITFSSYGSGDDPIISGADVISEWSIVPAVPEIISSSSAETNTTILTINTPTGVLAGDLLIAFIDGSGTNPTITDPDGWVTIDADQVQTDRFHLCYHYWASDENSYTWTFSADVGGLGGIICLRNCKSSSPIDAVSAWNASASGSTATALGLNTGTNNCMVLAIMGAAYGATRSWSTIAEWNEIFDLCTGAGTLAIDNLLFESAGATGDQTSDLAGGGSPWASRQISILPTTEFSTVYSKSGVTTEPKIVIYDSNILTHNDEATTSVGSNEWDWNSNTLYVNVDEDPNTNTLEASQRNTGISIGDYNYVNIKNLEIQSTNSEGFEFGYGPTNYIIIDNCTISKNGHIGIFAWTDNETIQNVTIQNCTISYNQASGFNICASCNNWLIKYNNVHHNSQGNVIYTGGIYLYDTSVTNILVEHNSVYSNGVATDNEAGYGIWSDTTGAGTIIRYNLVYDNTKFGVFVEENTGTEVYYNLVYDNDEGQILLSRNIHDNKIYNNIGYGGNVGLWIKGNSSLTENDVTGNLIKNNIFSDWSSKAISAINGAENDGTYGSGNVYEYNCLGAEAENFIEWGSGTYKSTYDVWEAAYGSSTHSVEADPLFTDADSNDFTLQSSSPCINAGVDVGLTQDYAGNTIGKIPDIGAYEMSIDNPLSRDRYIYDYRKYYRNRYNNN